MGLTYKGVEPDEITYNGQPVDSVLYNGVEVWSSGDFKLFEISAADGNNSYWTALYLTDKYFVSVEKRSEIVYIYNKQSHELSTKTLADFGISSINDILFNSYWCIPVTGKYRFRSVLDNTATPKTITASVYVLNEETLTESLYDSQVLTSQHEIVQSSNEYEAFKPIGDSGYAYLSNATSNPNNTPWFKIYDILNKTFYDLTLINNSGLTLPIVMSGFISGLISNVVGAPDSENKYLELSPYTAQNLSTTSRPFKIYNVQFDFVNKTLTISVPANIVNISQLLSTNHFAGAKSTKVNYLFTTNKAVEDTPTISGIEFNLDYSTGTYEETMHTIYVPEHMANFTGLLGGCVFGAGGYPTYMLIYK